MRRLMILIVVVFGVVSLSGGSPAVAAAYPCPPTEPDSMGPFYEPGAPLRLSVARATD